MTDFAKLPDDERREWRDDPVTQAFIAWLKQQSESSKSYAIAAVANLSDQRLPSMYVGEQNAFNRAVDTATRETFE